MNYITEDDLFASVSYITGAGLTRKFDTLSWSVTVILESDGTPNREDLNIVLGTTSSSVN